MQTHDGAALSNAGHLRSEIVDKRIECQNSQIGNGATHLVHIGLATRVFQRRRPPAQKTHLHARSGRFWCANPARDVRTELLEQRPLSSAAIACTTGKTPKSIGGALRHPDVHALCLGRHLKLERTCLSVACYVSSSCDGFPQLSRHHTKGWTSVKENVCARDIVGLHQKPDGKCAGHEVPNILVLQFRSAATAGEIQYDEVIRTILGAGCGASTTSDGRKLYAAAESLVRRHLATHVRFVSDVAS